MTNSTSKSSTRMLLIAAALSASAINHDSDYNFNFPDSSIFQTSLSDWQEDRFGSYEDVVSNIELKAQFETILDFSKTLLNNSIDIDKEFIEIVDKNFWDII